MTDDTTTPLTDAERAELRRERDAAIARAEAAETLSLHRVDPGIAQDKIAATLAARETAERERDEARGGPYRHECAECKREMWSVQDGGLVWCGVCTFAMMERRARDAERDLAAARELLRDIAEGVCTTRPYAARAAALLGKEAKGGEPLYPCAKCGKARTKAEGGTTFAVCDACWDGVR
jgi:DNA-directed RNA polymerase subunit RPC12/RpoP